MKGTLTAGGAAQDIINTSVAVQSLAGRHRTSACVSEDLPPAAGSLTATGTTAAGAPSGGREVDDW